MIKAKQTNTKLLLILCFAFLLRFPGVFWGELYSENYDVLEPDEHVHLAIAIEFMQKLDSSIFEDYHPDRLNVPGLGVQIGLIGLPIMKYAGSNFKYLLLTGRMLSVLYALLLIILIYKITLFLFFDSNLALLSAFLLSIFDLNVTYSHYAVPEISYVFWAYLSLYFMLKLGRETQNKGTPSIIFWCKEKKKLLLVLILSIGLTIAIRLDVIPIVVLGMLVLYFSLSEKRFGVKNIIGFGVLTFLTFLFFQIAIGFQNQKLIDSFVWLFKENSDLVGGNWHYLYNPILYLAAIIGGISLPVFAFFCYGSQNLFKKAVSFNKLKPEALIIILFLLLEFLLRWRMDATFVRRGNIFLPLLAIISAYGMITLYKSLKPNGSNLGKYMVISSIFYCIALTIISQYNFVFENRYSAIEYLQKENFDGKQIYYSPYAKLKNRVGIDSNYENAEILVLHESYYSRYTKSFTTPFQIPTCCEGVYHCLNKAECLFYQDVLSNSSSYELLFENKPFDLFPERLLYKKLFGTYETFLGDVKVFKKK